MQPPCYHICFDLRISFAGRHRIESKHFLLSKMGIFNVLFHMLSCWTNHSQELCVGAFCYARILLLLSCEQVFWGRASSVSSYFLKSLIPPKLQICKTFAHVWIYICVFVVNFDALAQASDFRIERRHVVFLCWMQDSKLGSLRHQFASRLNAHSQTGWATEDQAKIWNSTTRPYDEWAFRPLVFTADRLSNLALAIYMLRVI